MAVAHPTDSRLLETARAKLVALAREQGVVLRQTFAEEGGYLRLKAGRYAHARQFNRMRRVIRGQRTIVGRIARQLATRLTPLSAAIGQTLAKAGRIVAHSARGAAGIAKLYSFSVVFP